VKKRWKWIAIGAAVVLAAMLLIHPRLTNPPVLAGHDLFATNAPPPEIGVLLRHACYDCHSSETKWPWYSHVAPVSWWLADHVNEGRRHLNFSDWPHDDPRRAARKWSRISEEVDSGDMPLASYTWAHPAARLSPEQRDRLVTWAQAEADRLRPKTEEPEPQP
jgi:hypothetical protein